MAATTVENLQIRISTSGNTAAREMNSLSSSLASVSKASQPMVKGLHSIAGAFQRITFYRFVRSIIKEIGKAFQEGSQNAYFFSKAIGGDLAAALDMLATKNFTMTNQMGAAWATLLQTVQPILLQLIGIITRAAEVITQFFAILGGKTTYLKAIDYSKEWASTTKAGAAAAKEWKNQLMGFDEINRLDDSSGSSGGGGNALPNYGAMFEEAPIESWISRFKDRIASIVDDIKLIFTGLYDFIAGVFTGNWDRAFKGLADIVKGFGNLINDYLQLDILVFDGFVEQVEEIIDGLFKWIENKTGLDMSKVRETILYELNLIRFTIEAWTIKLGWIIQDLAEMISSVLKGDWQGAWEAAQKAVKDASIDIDALVAEMAQTVTEKMMGVSSNVSKHSRSSHSSVAAAAEGIGDSVAGAGNASATFAEIFSANMNVVRDQLTSLGQSSLTVQSTGDTLSFVAKVASAVSKIARFARFVTNPGLHAEGGFPNQGELFIAREAGPELVGQINGRTAVANNDQIVQGISTGVYNAVVSAMSMSGGKEDQPIQIYLDGRLIARSTTAYQKQFARCGVM